MRRLIALSVMVVSAVAYAQSDEAALDALHKGQLLLENGALHAAREQFAEAARLAPTKPNPYFYEAVADSKLSRCADALLDLEYYFKLAPAGHAHMAEATSMRDQCRAAVKPKLGVLVVNSDPAGAEVRLDDSASAPRGTTPFRAPVPAGSHLVYLTRDGHSPESRSVNVVVEQEASLDVALKPLGSTATPSPPEKVDNLSVQAKQVNINTSETTAAQARKKKPRYWIAGVVVGVVVVGVTLGVGLGIGLNQTTNAAVPGTTSLSTMQVHF